MTTLTLPSFRSATEAGRPTDVAAATPATRERYVDFLRVFSLAVVMFGHWLMAAVEWRDGRLVAGNVLEAAPAAQLLTWIFQIMPVFFVVGGFSNTASWTAAVRDGRGYGAWLGSRLVRLVRPVLVFAAVWTAVVVALAAAGVDPAAVRARSIAQPLWFLAVYVVVVAVAPAMVAAQRRWGWGVVAALGVAVAAVDLARWPFGVPLVGWANLALVWLFAHQLGVAWRDGDVRAWTRRRLVLLAASGLGGMLVLTGLAGYSNSMVGVGQGRSNTFPPSLALVALGTWQFAAALLLRPAVDRWLDRRLVWAAVVAANGMAMTVFLWHLTALVIVSAATLPTGLIASPPAGSVAWWAWRPVWIVALVLALVPLVVAFARVELRRITPPSPSAVRAGVAAVLLAAGMAVLARKGFVPAGMVGAGLVAGGWVVLRRA
jgi:peptidoglycan/LPS O-acetylase OafA/YrhL